MLNVISGLLSGAGAPASTNSYESISTVTVGSGGVSSVSFSSIPSTFKHLQIRAVTRNATGDYSTYARFNSDSATNYSYHALSANGSAFGVFAGTTTSDGIYAGVTNVISNGFGGFVLDILDYADTNKYKTSRTLWGQDQNGAGNLGLASGSWRSTSAINSIEFRINGTLTFAQYSQFALYGIKG